MLYNYLLFLNCWNLSGCQYNVCECTWPPGLVLVMICSLSNLSKLSICPIFLNSKPHSSSFLLLSFHLERYWILGMKYFHHRANLFCQYTWHKALFSFAWSPVSQFVPKKVSFITKIRSFPLSSCYIRAVVLLHLKKKPTRIVICLLHGKARWLLSFWDFALSQKEKHIIVRGENILLFFLLWMQLEQGMKLYKSFVICKNDALWGHTIRDLI